MKNKVEIKYVSAKNEDFLTYTPDHWELTVWSDIVGKQVVHLTTEQALVVAIAVGLVKDIGKKEGYEKAKKKYKAIDKISRMNFHGTNSIGVNMPWEDSNKPMQWDPKLMLHDPNA
jgi:hypothetical protein